LITIGYDRFKDMKTSMVKKTGEKQVKRDSRGRFVKGKSPNPSGRPKGSRNFTTTVRKTIEKLSKDGVDIKEEIAKVVVTKALEGDHKMIKLMWNYLDGPPISKANEDESAINLNVCEASREHILNKIYKEPIV
jgi:hypothetical protein